MTALGQSLLTVENLTVRFGRGTPAVVDGVSLSIAAGECLALVGESGSGKSVTARTLIGLAGAGAVVRADTLTLAGESLLAVSGRRWRRLRGERVGFVLQDALGSLDPLRPVGREIDDALRLHTRLGPAQRRERVLQLLTDAGVPDPELRAGQRAGELSGGLRQRALIASAVALAPPLLIADEPTTALDVTVQQQVLGLLDAVRSRGTAILLISHDLSVVERIADRVAVMRAGRIVETGPTALVLAEPQHEYTKALLRAVPSRHPRGTPLSVTTRPADATASLGPASPGPASAPSVPSTRAPAALRLEHVSKAFRTAGRGILQAVDDVCLTVAPGSTLGLVGESGSGKSTTARIALGLATPDAGDACLFDEPWNPLPESQRRPRRHLIGAIYQDPLASFDPRWSVGQLLADAISGGRARGSGIRRADDRDRVADLLGSVGLSPDLMSRHTGHLSGGERQRVSIARAIAPQPRVLVCDEPVSSLDVSVQAQVLDLLDELQQRLGLSYLFISHDLGVIRHVSDRVAVMSEGRIVETGDAECVFLQPEHPYTRRLLASALHRA